MGEDPGAAPAVEPGDGEPIPAREWMRSLGAAIKQARAGRCSIEELAAEAGVSSGRISQIERGIANPSFETLWRLARALDLPIGTFFEGPSSHTRMLVRADERKRLVLPHDDLEYELLTPDLRRSLEVFKFHVPPGFDNSARPISHVGEECIHLLSGELEVHVNGSKFDLGEGDSITYDSSLPHFVCNSSKARAVAIAAITPPSF